MAKDGKDNRNPSQPAIPGLKGHAHSTDPEVARRRARATMLRDKNRQELSK